MTLINQGFHPLLTDDLVYIKFWPGTVDITGKALIIVVTHVDDMLICGPNSGLISQFKKQLSNAFDMQDLGPVTYFLGVRIVRNRAERSIQLIQDVYIRKVLKRFNIELRKLTSGYIFFFAGGIISAQSKRQSITALSTTEAEY